ncbi:MAG TPA: hypothetical protein VMZ00_01120 [Sporichthya sp.]|nr:hypothetical protein [Sporichthya sp.]
MDGRGRVGGRLAAALLATVLLPATLAGCGGGGSGDGQDPQAAASAAAGAGGVLGSDGRTVAGGAAAGGGAAAAVDGSTKVVPGKSQFMVLKLGGWELGEAVRPTGKSRPQYQQLDKSLDWYATYDQPAADQSVLLNGHLRPLAGQTTILRRAGAGKVQTGDINGRQASWVDQRGGNIVVLIALTPTYTVELVASGVDLEGALAIARALTPADEAQWKAAGGRIIDCLGAGQECIGT